VLYFARRHRPQRQPRRLLASLPPAVHLSDSKGRVVAYEKHLLSMKDNDQSANLEALVDAGIRSFKIEGRYKDMGYVKNITAHYRLLLDEIMERRTEFSRAASGRTNILFTPDVDKTFHRGHTDYFANGRLDDIGASTARNTWAWSWAR
jgi:putative protease